MKKNILLTIEYDGRDFHGWQRQPGLRTVQGTVEEALSIALKQEITIEGTGRTDAGVHALDQKATFSADFGLPVEKLPLVLNNILAKGKTGAGISLGDVRIVDAEEVSEDFHARFDCTGKTYRYILNTGRPDIFRKDYCYFVERSLDFEAMEEAAKALVGTFDFKSFESAGGNPRLTTVRTIYDVKLQKTEGQIVIDVTGDGFLYNMVRIIVGTLVDVGLGRIEASKMPEIIASCNRENAGHTAPAAGLYMAKVYFGNELCEKTCEKACEEACEKKMP